MKVYSFVLDIVRLKKDQSRGSKFRCRGRADLKTWTLEARCFSL